ncbi:MAG TPA: hypothetical protein PLP25_07760 [Candidatus Limiplasma sp.]|nr:hypothetical protein [Candidatus Limiplasma sp.]HPS81737.1 hypothetical protein [Candidatus Limiplasma sp.]
MQPTLERTWWQSARLNGVLRYQWKALSRGVGLVMLILMVSQAISFLMPLALDMTYPFTGIYADLGVTLVVALISACVAAGKSTRFLLRFGTSRLSVWLGNLIGLFAGMVGLLLGTMLLSMLMGALTLAMANAMPRKYVFQRFFGELEGATLYGESLTEALKTLPTYILYTLEWTCMFYLLGCCLRRNRAATLFVIIGVPMLLMILTLIPAVRQAARVMENADDRQMMLLGIQWLKYLTDFVHFVEHEWPTLQLAGAVVSLPLSYLCMRGTPQP